MARQVKASRDEGRLWMFRGRLIDRSPRHAHTTMRIANRTPSGARPNEFRDACHEAMMGRSSYEGAAFLLTGLLSGIGPRELPADQWRVEVAQLVEGVRLGEQDWALSWFDHWLLRCMSLVPLQHSLDFIEGVERALREPR